MIQTRRGGGVSLRWSHPETGARRYFEGKELRPQDAWEHVYRLLLSVDRLTRLAHIYDSNHMEEGGNFHSRAVRFTKLLCERWSISQKELPEQVDLMFRACVEAYLAHRKAAAARAAKAAISAVLEEGAEEGEAEAKSAFLIDIAGLLADRLGSHHPTVLRDLALEIERQAEHYFTIERKRQNVRGEGFEDTLEWLLLRMTGLSPSQVRVRKRASDLPGFKPDPRHEGQDPRQGPQAGHRHHDADRRPHPAKVPRPNCCSGSSPETTPP